MCIKMWESLGVGSQCDKFNVWPPQLGRVRMRGMRWMKMAVGASQKMSSMRWGWSGVRMGSPGCGPKMIQDKRCFPAQVSMLFWGWTPPVNGDVPSCWNDKPGMAGRGCGGSWKEMIENIEYKRTSCVAAILSCCNPLFKFQQNQQVYLDAVMYILVLQCVVPVFHLNDKWKMCSKP